MDYKDIGLKPPKEKAKLIYEQMYKIAKGELQYPNKVVAYKAKQCSITAIKAILFEEYPLFLPDTNMDEYWENVISELNAL